MKGYFAWSGVLGRWLMISKGVYDYFIDQADKFPAEYEGVQLLHIE